MEVELHPILEQDTSPNPKLWYVLSGLGDCPSMRVGHTCSFIKGQNGSNGKIYVIGGANPSGCFNDTYVLDLETLSWDTIDSSGFCSRYEHAAFVAESQPDKIYIFGGANQSGNLNDVQVFDTVKNTWSTVGVKGDPPSARTYRTSACVGDKFLVYSGGQSGADPVGDRQVHSFDVTTAMWSVLTVKGDPPKPRHGHVMVGVGNKLFVHGGMSGTTFYDDLHVLDLSKNTWSVVKQKRGHPSSRAAHGGVAHGNNVYVFGGMNKDGAIDDLYKLDVATMKWSKLDWEGPPPASRLDFAMCTIQRLVPAVPDKDLSQKAQEAKKTLDAQIEAMKIGDKGQSIRSAATEESSSETLADAPASSTPGQEPPAPSEDLAGAAGGDNGGAVTKKLVTLCFVSGGMDTEGEIFDDCVAYLLE